MKCSRCPAIDRSGRCEGESVSRICELVDPGHPFHQPEWHAKLRGEIPPEEPRPTVAASLDLIRRRNACPHAECRTGCQSTLCRFPWRQRAVSLDDCRVCLGPA